MKKQLLSTPSTKGSASLRLLAQSLSNKLGYKVFRTTQPNPRREQLLYGGGVDKLTQYRWFQQQGLSALEFTTDPSVACEWVNQDHVVFGRKYLNSSCGKGIVVFEGNNNATDGRNTCPVYTKYKKKKREFRVHVFKDRVVVVTEKKRRKGFEGKQDTKIRNLENGYVFCHIPVEEEPKGLRELAVQAAQVSPSHFRGVDIGYNEKNNDLFIIEVNSAPGIQGSNIQTYTEVICG